MKLREKNKPVGRESRSQRERERGIKRGSKGKKEKEREREEKARMLFVPHTSNESVTTRRPLKVSSVRCCKL